MIAKNISKQLLVYAEQETKQIIVNIINKSLTKEMIDDFDQDKLYTITKNSDNEIQMIDYNSNMVNSFLNTVTTKIEDDLNNSEELLFKIPIGVITNSPLFNNFGPKIPVKIRQSGYILTNVKTDVKGYGLNSSLISMTMEINIKVRILLPIISKEISIDNEIPISYKVMSDNISTYYGAYGITKSSSVFKSIS